VKKSSHSAFTLMEVMVAVVIISVVIAALLQMMGNSSNIFSKIKTESDVSQYASFMIASKDYGFENKSVTMDKFSDNFLLDTYLRRDLKKLKAKLVYTELEAIDMSDFDEEASDDDTREEDLTTTDEQQVSSGLIFEIGKSTLVFKNGSTSLLRLRIQ